VVLRAKLARLGRWNAARRAAAAHYDQLLEPLEVGRPTTLEGNEHVWHLYVIRLSGETGANRRDDIVTDLNRAGIGAGVHYPMPIHLTRAFADLGYRAGDFPHAEAAAAEILSLPIYPQIRPDQQHQVVRHLASGLG